MSAGLVLAPDRWIFHKGEREIDMLFNGGNRALDSREAFQGITEAFLVTDACHKIVYWTGRADEIHLFGAEYLRGKSHLATITLFAVGKKRASTGTGRLKSERHRRGL